MDVAALRVTLALASCTALILLVLGLPLAYALWRWSWKGKSLIEALVTLPLFLPPTVLGFFLLVALGPQGYLGQPLEHWFGQRLVFSFPGIVLGSVLFNLPFAVRPFLASLQAIDVRLLEASWCLGESRFRTFLRVVVPLAWPGILTGLVLTFAHTVGEFGVVFMVGGNIPGVTRTLSTAIYDDVQALDYSGAFQGSLTLLSLCFLSLVVAQFLSRRLVAR